MPSRKRYVETGVSPKLTPAQHQAIMNLRYRKIKAHSIHMKTREGLFERGLIQYDGIWVRITAKGKDYIHWTARSKDDQQQLGTEGRRTEPVVVAVQDQGALVNRTLLEDVKDGLYDAMDFYW